MRIREAVETVNKSLYPNIEFKSGVISGAYPERDKINSLLLADIETAAKNSSTRPTITTAVSGHVHTSSRHPAGDAVDIAIMNGQGFSSEKDAEQKGILDDINKFVAALQSLGYTKNTESGNQKAVLTFGFKGHDDHIHVSYSSKIDTNSSNTSGAENSGQENQTSQTTPSQSSGRAERILQGVLGTGLEAMGFQNESSKKQKLLEEIKKIKKLM